MDKGKTAGRFDWLPAQMPGVARLIAGKRAELGREWVNTCWQRGVVQCEPGWFYASEGGLAVGTIWTEVAQAVLEAQILASKVTDRQAGGALPCMLFLRAQEVTHA